MISGNDVTPKDSNESTPKQCKYVLTKEQLLSLNLATSHNTFLTLFSEQHFFASGNTRKDNVSLAEAFRMDCIERTTTCENIIHLGYETNKNTLIVGELPEVVQMKNDIENEPYIIPPKMIEKLKNIMQIGEQDAKNIIQAYSQSPSYFLPKAISAGMYGLFNLPVSGSGGINKYNLTIQVKKIGLINDQGIEDPIPDNAENVFRKDNETFFECKVGGFSIYQNTNLVASLPSANSLFKIKEVTFDNESILGMELQSVATDDMIIYRMLQGVVFDDTVIIDLLNSPNYITVLEIKRSIILEDKYNNFKKSSTSPTLLDVCNKVIDLAKAYLSAGATKHTFLTDMNCADAAFQCPTPQNLCNLYQRIQKHGKAAKIRTVGGIGAIIGGAGTAIGALLTFSSGGIALPFCAVIGTIGAGFFATGTAVAADSIIKRGNLAIAEANLFSELCFQLLRTDQYSTYASTFLTIQLTILKQSNPVYKTITNLITDLEKKDKWADVMITLEKVKKDLSDRDVIANIEKILESIHLAYITSQNHKPSDYLTFIKNKLLVLQDEANARDLNKQKPKNEKRNNILTELSKCTSIDEIKLKLPKSISDLNKATTFGSTAAGELNKLSIMIKDYESAREKVTAKKDASQIIVTM